MDKLVRKVEEIAHHRNGVGGIGFYVVRFRSRPDDKDEAFLGVVFPERGAVAVVSLDRIDVAGVAFARGNSWRGDCYEPELRDAIEKYENVRNAEDPWRPA